MITSNEIYLYTSVMENCMMCTGKDADMMNIFIPEFHILIIKKTLANFIVKKLADATLTK